MREPLGGDLSYGAAEEDNEYAPTWAEGSQRQLTGLNCRFNGLKLDTNKPQLEMAGAHVKDGLNKRFQLM